MGLKVPGDLDMSCKVDYKEIFALIQSVFGATAETTSFFQTDTNSDAKLDSRDVIILVSDAEKIDLAVSERPH